MPATQSVLIFVVLIIGPVLDASGDFHSSLKSKTSPIILISNLSDLPNFTILLNCKKESIELLFFV